MQGRSSTAALAIVVAIGMVALSAQAPDPRVGSWTLNVAKSKYSPGPGPKSQTLKVEAVGQGEKVTSESVTSDGTRVTQQYTANYDGKDYPITGSPVADTVSLRRIDSHTTERTDKRGGKVVQTLHRVVSKDGKTLTTTTKGTNPQGQPVNNVAVFEKQ